MKLKDSRTVAARFPRPTLGAEVTPDPCTSIQRFFASLRMTDMATIAKPLAHSTARTDLIGLALVSFTALAAVKLSEAAGWMDLPRLIPLCLIGLAASILLARARWPLWSRISMGVVLGAGVILAFAAGAIAEDTWKDKVTVLAKRLRDWWELVSTGGTTKDNLPLVLLLLAVMWLIAYLSVWLFLASKRKWLAILPSAAWILVNVRYVPLAASFYYAVYLAAVVLLVVYLRLRPAWERPQRVVFLAFLLGITVPFLALSWAIPRAALSQYLGTLKSVSESQWGQMEVTFNRYFSPNPAVETNAPAPGTPLHTFGPEMVLKGNLNVPETKVMNLYTEVAGYLRGATYEVYTGSGWKQMDPAGPAVGKRLDAMPDPYSMRRQITQTIVVGSATDVVFAIGQPVSTSLHAIGMFPTPMSFTVPLDGSSSLFDLPADVRKMGQDLATYYATRPPVTKTTPISRPETPGFTIRRVVRDGSALKAVELVRAETDIPDLMGLRNPIALRPGAKYTIVSSISYATYVELRTAGDDYPAWVTDRYLQLPRNLPESVKQLAYQTAQGADNSYDKAMAIESYLRQLNYNTAIKAPPSNTDVVEYFLFKAPEGYCNYFATAMVVMLRSIGIPARMAVGFNHGEYDLEQEAWTIKESNAHAWPEVFFPQYGWVEFEPTPSQPLLAHEPPGANLEDAETEDVTATDTVEEESWVAREPGIPVFGGIAVLLLAGLLTWHLSLRRLPMASKIYAKMGRLGFLARVRRRPFETPLEYSRRLAGEMPSHSREIETIAGIYTRTTFGRKPLAAPDREELRSSWDRLRTALLLHAVRLG